MTSSRPSIETRRPAVAEPASLSVLLAAEQLRRRVPGGIGTYARGLLGGLAIAATEGDGVEVALLASRPPGGVADPLAAFGRPLHTSRLPGRLLTRAWDHRLIRAPAGFDVVHSVSLASPQLRRSSSEQLVVTVHDVAWRRHPAATTRRGARWHEAALRRAAAPKPHWWCRPGWWRPTWRRWASPVAGSLWCRAAPIIFPRPMPPPPMSFSGRWASPVSSSSP